MTPLALSAEQAAAATAPLRDVCVTAGAGSGKTRVLVARFVHLVRAHGLSPRRVAALTFTEKAARELRTRISAAFAAPEDRRLRAEVEAAPISTLHAFCARLLHRNAVEAGVDPAFRVLDETEALLLREQARGFAERRLLAAPDAGPALAALRRIPGSDPLATAEQVLEALRGAGGEPRGLRWHAGPAGEAGALAAVRSAAAALAEAQAALPERRADVAEVLAATERVVAGEPGALESAAESVGRLSPGRAKAVRPVLGARDALAEALDLLAGTRLDAVGANDVVPGLATVLEGLGSAADALKRERDALDFTDLERETLALLTKLDAAGRRPAGMPDVLLVDEHQDTNPVQEALLARLRARGAVQFSVGDPQQSIYRFRRADVRVLTGERERVGAEGRKRLAESYRATPELVGTLNALHARLFAGGRGGVAHEPLAAVGPFAPAAPGDPPAVEWALLDRAGLGAVEGRRREAGLVADRLRALHGTPRRRRDGGVACPALGWDDMAVLVRARTDLGLLEEALTSRDIRFRVHRGRGWRKADEIEALVHALRVVHNPLDRHALACLVTGPALAADDDALLRWFGQADEPWSLLARDTDPRVATLVGTVEALRRLAVGDGLAATVSAAVDRLGLLDVAAALPDGARRTANLRRSVSGAHDLARAGRHDLPAFLRWLEELERLEVEQAEAPGATGGEPAVTLLTVHAAKGLEWPVVVLAQVDRRGEGRLPDFLLAHDGAVALRLADPLEGGAERPAGFDDLAAREARASEEEALRLLYVATTRAEERLLLTGTYDGPTKDGRPKRADGWARSLWDALGVPLVAGTQDVVLDAAAPCQATLRVTIAPALDAAAPAIESGTQAPASEPAAAPATPAPLATLGGTRYVVTVSELMAFARSPAELLAAREVPEERSDVPIGDAPGAPGAATYDRAALGRAVHAALERWSPGAPVDLGPLLATEHPLGVPPEAAPLATEMTVRFGRSPVASALASAVATGEARREVAFHARIRFPAGASVGAFQHLLVKGTIDLWLPREGGIVLVDHKTNAPSQGQRTPADLAERYAVQMRLYALAAERLLGHDVAGASLLLLHPGWGPEAVEVPVDVSGPALEDTRRLCQAFAVASLEDRWPADWRELVAPA